MLRFAANLTGMFCEYPLLTRFRAARGAGFDAVELLSPYEHPAQELRAELDRHHLTMALINTPAEWAAGDFGSAAVPGRENRFRREFQTALDTATALSAHHIHIMSGLAAGAEARDVFLGNLDWAAAQAPDQSLLIEPLNKHDVPGYFLNDFDQAAEILQNVNAPNLHLQFDAYHAHLITADVLSTWQRYRDISAHVQVSSAEGRHEPTSTGAINYAAFFRQLLNDQYGGFVSAEYKPSGCTLDGLDWRTLTDA